MYFGFWFLSDIYKEFRKQDIKVFFLIQAYFDGSHDKYESSRLLLIISQNTFLTVVNYCFKLK
jgi:hypothetical protein